MRRNTATALSPVVVKVMPVKLFKAMVREDGFLQASAAATTTAQVCVCVCVERERAYQYARWDMRLGGRKRQKRNFPPV